MLLQQHTALQHRTVTENRSPAGNGRREHLAIPEHHLSATRDEENIDIHDEYQHLENPSRTSTHTSGGPNTREHRTVTPSAPPDQSDSHNIDSGMAAPPPSYDDVIANEHVYNVSKSNSDVHANVT